MKGGTFEPFFSIRLFHHVFISEEINFLIV
jgi:hypothetical protein